MGLVEHPGSWYAADPGTAVPARQDRLPELCGSGCYAASTGEGVVRADSAYFIDDGHRRGHGLRIVDADEQRLREIANREQCPASASS